MHSFELAELARRLENLIRNGTIAEADYPAARVRVKYDEDENGQPVLTDWLPWLTTRASNDSNWWAPEVGEQVMVLSPSGNMALGVALPAIYQTAHPAPENDPNKHRTVYADGSFTEYDRAAHTLTVSINGDTILNVAGNVDAVVGGNVDLLAGGNINLDATNIHHNGGTGVITQESICHFTGNNHGDGSGTVTAGK